MGICKKCNVEFEGKRCKPCWNAYMRAWNADNPEKVRLATKKWRKNNIEKAKEIDRKYSLKWEEMNRGKRCAIAAKYRAANKEKCDSYNKQYRIENPDFNRIVCQNRAARKRVNGGKLSKGLAEKLYKLQHGKCVCCGKLLGNDYHLDHIMPIALGGANEDWNIQLLTRRCNSQKNAKHPVVFMRARGFLL